MMDTKEIYQDFIGTVCRNCGAQKVKNQSFCRHCYRRLPPKMKHALYNRFYDGYEEAFEAAVEWLKPSKE